MRHSFIRGEYKFILGLLFIVVFFLPALQPVLAPHSISFALVLFLVLFAVMIGCAFSVVKHADWLAHQFGEPYGTIILTLSVISIEVALISAVMLAGNGSSMLARDTMFAVLMITLNGLVGLSLLVGGLKHHLQQYNLHGANAFLAVLVPLATIGLISPNYTKAASYGMLSNMQSGFLIIISLVLYAVFLSIQTVRHQDFFKHPEKPDIEQTHDINLSRRRIIFHFAMLLLTLIVLVLLSKKLAVYIDYTIMATRAPAALSGLIVAILVLTPEGVSAIQAAWRNKLQRCVNLCLGSALASLSLTIPAVLTISLIAHQPIILGLSPTDSLLLFLSLAVSMMTFVSHRTHVLQGVIHIFLFLTYIVFIFDVYG